MSQEGKKKPLEMSVHGLRIRFRRPAASKQASKMERDAFASLIPDCQLTPSQEEKLRNCPFAGAREASSPETPSTSSIAEDTPLTAIRMVSPPESQKYQSSPHEEFQTPPEHSHSQQSLNEDQVPQAKGTIRKYSGAGDGKNVAVDDKTTDAHTAVDLGKDSKHLGLTSRKVKLKFKDRDLVSGVGCSHCALKETRSSKVGENGIGNIRFWEAECGDSLSKRCRVFRKEPDRETTNPQVRADHNGALNAETERFQNGTRGAENPEEFEQHFAGLVDLMIKTADKLNEEISKTESGCGTGVVARSKKDKNVERVSASKNINEIDKFKYVGSKGRRELPFSMRSQAKNIGEESSFPEESFADLLSKALKILKPEGNDDTEMNVNIVETAKKCGWFSIA